MSAVLPSDKSLLPNYDKRSDKQAQIAAERSEALGQLRARVQDVKADFDVVTGSARWVRSGEVFLSGQNGQRGGISAGAIARWPQADPHRILKAFLEEHAKLFGHGAEVLEGARLKRQFITAHNGLQTVVWEQQLNGLAVFEGLLIAHTTKNNELVGICSGFLPKLEQAADLGTPNRATLQVRPVISAPQALVLAAGEVGESLETADLIMTQPAQETNQRQQFRAPKLNGESILELVWLPMDSARLRLCWQVILTSHARGELFRVLIDAQTGEPLLRHCLTSYLTDVTYRVFSSDSPSPFSPGYSTPTSSQSSLTSRSLMTLSAANTNASPNGWIDDGVNETRGNNVDAHTDWNDDDQPDLPRPQGSPLRVFDFAMDLASQGPTNYSSAAVVQLFYWCNWMHDKLYELGFTEAAGNFQNNNFGRGGIGNDAVQADAQDGGGFNNANFSVDYDGNPGRMQMYVFNGPAPARDGDFDTEVVLHEYTHGLSNRRVGGGALITAPQSEGLGEGWSDFYALALLSEPGDDVNGTYAAAAYVSYLLNGLTQNYYFGIRRYPYCTDLNKNPLTFKDIDPAQASAHSGVPKSPTASGSDAEVHHQGEVWCVTLWEARARLIQKYGWAAGNQLVLRLVTDGMNLSPANPNFLEARDAILQADLLDNGAADLKELWAAFGKRGMGFSATSPASSTTTGVQEAFDPPSDALQILPLSGLSSGGRIGGPFVPAMENFTLLNTGTNPLTWAAVATVPWLGLSASGGTLPTNSSATVSAFINSAASSLAKGLYSGTVWFTNTSSGAAFMRPVTLVIGKGVVAWGENYYGQGMVPEDLFDVVAIACGNYFNIALKRDGTLRVWGDNTHGQTNVPAGLGNVTAFAGGGGHILALKNDGSVKAWGWNDYLQCAVPPNLSNVMAVAAGVLHSLALKADGTIVGWGAGQFVTDPSDGRNYGQAQIPPGLSNVIAIAAGDYHSLALKADGTVVAWGANFYGQANVPFGLTGIAAIAANGYNNVALRGDGTVTAWGVNYEHETDVPPGLSNVVAIAEGESYSLALKTDGTVVTWGDFGQYIFPAGGLSNVVAIAAGWYHALALMNDGSLTAPFIYRQPLRRVSISGSTAIFDTGAVASPALSYHWRKDGVELSNGRGVYGANSPTLALYDVSLSDAGNYSVLISSPGGSIVSSNATLVVLDPGIVSQPMSSTNVFGSTPSFAVMASGTTPLRYQWKKNGLDLADGGNISGAATPTLSISAVQPADAANYTVLVSNHRGAITSALAVLTVITAPEIARQPLSRTQLPATSASFTVVGRGAAPLAYRWLRNGAYLSNSGNISGAFTSRLVVNNLTMLDAADYSVLITNSFGSITSAPAHLKVNNVRGHVVAWGDDQYGQLNVPAGLTNIVALDVGGYHNVALKADGTVAEWGDSQFLPALSNVGAVDSSQGLDLVLKQDGTVGAWGWNYSGETNVPVDLSNVVAVAAGFGFAAALREDGTVLRWGANWPSLTNDLAQWKEIVAISAGDDHLVGLKNDGTLVVSGDNFDHQLELTPGLSNIVAVAAGGRHTLALKDDGTVVAWGGNYCGQTSVPFGLTGVAAVAAGLGSSIAVKRDGTLVAWGCFDRGASDLPPSGLINVAAAAGGYSHSLALINDFVPPTITASPSSRTTTAGTVVNFSATATGAMPLIYQWRKNGLNLADGGNISGANSSSLILASVLKADEGSYTVAVTNQLGFAISTPAMLTVIDPVFTIVPASRTNSAGTTATFIAGVNGTMPLNYQWLKNGVGLSNGGKISGAKAATLTLAGVDQTDAANYSVIVTNVAGSITSSPLATLIVIDPPAIVLQPTNRTLNVGEVARFAVIANGSSLHYHWKKGDLDLTDGANISGVNSTVLVLANVTKNDAGIYRVVITNTAGSATSEAAELKILDPLFGFSAPATDIRRTSAKLNGMVAPQSVPATAWLEWGTNNLYGQTTPALDAGSASGVVHITGLITNIQHGAVIHFRLAASNASQVVYGLDQQFVTGGRARTWGDDSSGQVFIPQSVGEVASIAGGLLHSLALRTDGTVAGWGNNGYGQITIPVTAELAAISAGGFHSLALRRDGTVIAWGRNDSGQTNVPAGLSNIVMIAAGGSHNLALRSDGSVAAWGNNSFGQATVPAMASNIVEVAAGWYHSLALRYDGTILAWGANTYGQATVPGLSNVVWVGAGLYHNLALRGDGTVAAWGYNGSGQTTVPGTITNIVSAACGGSHNLALTATGALMGWGYNFYGQTSVPGDLTNVVSFAAGGTHSLAIIPGPPMAAAPQLLASVSGFITNRSFRLVFTGTAYANYYVWSSTNLVNWISLGSAEEFSTGLFQFVDASATNSAYRFYRASAP